MPKRTCCYTAGAALVAAFSVAICTAARTPKGEKRDRWKGLTEEAALENVASQDTDLRNQAVHFLMEKREQRVRRLMQIIDKTTTTRKQNIMPRASAALLIGTMRAPEASQVLLEAMLLEAKNRPAAQVVVSPEEWHYPFRRALRRIGEPATFTLMKKIRTTDDENDAKECVRLLSHILGAGDALATLRRAYEHPDADDAAKGRLQKAMDEVEKRLP